MKLQKFFFILIVLFSFLQVSSAQETQEAELIDRFDNFGTDYFQSTLDNLIIGVRNNANSKGYVVIYGDKENPASKFVLEERFRNHLKYRRFEEKEESWRNRIYLVKGKDKDNSQIELWISKNGAEPKFESAEWDYKLSRNQKTYNFGAGNIEISIVNGKKMVWLGECSIACEPTANLQAFANHLLYNPEYEGVFTIYNNSKKKAKSISKLLTDILLNEYNVPRKQLKSIVSGTTSDNQFLEVTLTISAIERK